MEAASRGGAVHSTPEQTQCNFEAGQAIMAVLSALAGSSVHTFSIARNDALLSVGAWALCLPQLESLSVEANHVTVSVDLSPLKRLTRLSLLSRWEIPKFPLPTGMPPRLRELELQHFNAGAFSECATTAGALQHLQGLTLSRPSMDRSSVPWDWLLLRTALTSLTLSDWNGISTLPSQLAALTGLQQLGFQFCFLPDTDMAMHPLRALTALTSLDVTANGWECIPASVFALPSLQVGVCVSGFTRFLCKCYAVQTCHCCVVNVVTIASCALHTSYD